jgi:membrane-bound ClpP family serine protease
MDSELTFKTINYGILGILLLIAFILSVITIRKESRSDSPFRVLMGLTLAVIALCALVSLCMAYANVRSEKSISPHVQTEIVRSDALPR